MAGFYIANGPDIDAGTPNVIGVGNDGVNWTYLNKDGLDVRQFFQANAGTEAGKYPFENKTIIKIYKNEKIQVEFECQNVPTGAGTGEHTTWKAGTKAALEIAANEIAGWL